MHDIDEMSQAEGFLTWQIIYETRMEAQRNQVFTIKSHLDNLKNENLKTKVAEFLQWCMLQHGILLNVFY